MEKDQNDKNIGKKLDGRYEITELIGEGGMANVYRALDTVSHKVVAVKILKKEYSENEEFLRRFRDESKAIAMLTHPNFVRIYDVGFSERIQFIVMEYLDGITLNEYMEQQGQLDWRDAIHFILQILRALQHAHSKGVVHRDIKPQNIMVLRDGTIKIMDFGIAKFARENGKTGTDKAIGTVHYISPEQARGGKTDARSDLYSVGVMLYEMLTGKKPFDSDNPVGIAVMHMQEKVPLPHTIREDIQPGLEEIILKAMEKDPDERYQTAREMMDDIQMFKEDPDRVFGYYPNLTDDNEEQDNASKTRMFRSVAPREEEPEEDYEDEPEEESDESDEEDYDEDEEDDYDDDEEYEEEEGKSYFVPILSAIIIVVIVIAAVLFTSLIMNWINSSRGSNPDAEFAMPNLIGMDYQEAVLQYGDSINIQVESKEYSDLSIDKIFDQDIAADNPVSKGETVKVKVSLGAKKVSLQNVVGWDYSLAEATITQAGLQVDKRQQYSDTVPEGKVIKTDPEGPADLEPGSYVQVIVSRGENKSTVPVPNFTGMDWEDAKKMAENLHLKVQKEEINDTADEGIVIRQSIEDEEVSEDTLITLYVSNGIAPEKTVKVSFSIPAEASGTFQITFYEDGVEKVIGSPFNVAYANGVTSVSITGSGTVDYVVSLKNVGNGRTAQIGVYRVNFDSQSVNTVSSDVPGAFEQVGGVIATTTTPSSTTVTTMRTWWTPPPTSGQTDTTETTTTALPVNTDTEEE